MSWSEQVFRYCERGADPSFWGEPLNAASNAGFLAAAALAATRLAAAERESGAPHRDRSGIRLLIALVCAIGIGSFLFHTFATRWARLADVVPIGLFMLAYLGFALRAFLGLGWLAVLGGLALFLVANQVVAVVACPRQAVAITEYGRDPCLNGTMAYLPALAALALVGNLVGRGHPAGRLLLIAAGIFLVSMTLRWIDRGGCTWTMLLGRPRGTHALWHLLNALTLYVLLVAAIGGREPARRREGRAARA